ncbi:MAG: HAD-IIB family hydrolase, partial [Staphylococcus xylosus]|nr:HAD-IIB family hydrolase [Staphylococcus xylosus]
DPQLIYDVLETLTTDFELTNIVLSGIQSAYVKQTSSEEFLSFISNYYYDIEKVESFEQIEDDHFVKVAMRIKDKDLVKEVMDTLETKFRGELRAVTSGNDSVDLILPKVNKGVAIQGILKQWGIEHDELLAFGDANNDLEMLGLTTHSYAMANCSPEVEAVAQHKAPSNDDSGVLQVIEQYLKQQQ